MKKRSAKRRMDNTTLLLLLAACAVLLALLALALSRLFAPDEPQAPPEQLTFSLLSVSADNITSVTLAPNGKPAATLTKTENSFAWSEDADYPLDKEKLNAFLASLSSVSATVKVSETATDQDLTLYGFDRAHTITVHAGETVHTLYIGNKYNYGKSYYVRLAGDPAIYRADESDIKGLRIELSDLLFTASLPNIPLADLKSADLAAGGNTTSYNADAHATILSQLRTAVGAIDTATYADYNVTDEELLAYGLADGARKLSLHVERTIKTSVYSEQLQQYIVTTETYTETLTYTIGNTVTVGDKQLAYVRITAKNFPTHVYYMDASAVDALTTPAT